MYSIRFTNSRYHIEISRFALNKFKPFSIGVIILGKQYKSVISGWTKQIEL